MRYPAYINEIIKRFEDVGEHAYIVGGSLRDMLIGLPPHDYDIATSALPDKTCELFSDKRVIKTGIKHGTVCVLFDGEPVEITTLRIDGSYADSRHPDSVSFTRDITEDLSRRDFTVNAIAYNPALGIIDPFGGKADIENRILRTVGSPRLRFSEDALRIMRLYRFCAQLEFDIEADTLAGAAAMADGLDRVARERIHSELFRLLSSQRPYRALSLMKKSGIFEHVFDGYSPDVSLINKVELLPSTDVLRLALLLWGTDKETAAEHLRSLRCSTKQTTGTLAILEGARTSVVSALDARKLIAHAGIYAPLAARLSVVLGISPNGAAELVEKQQNTPSKVTDLKINGKDISELSAKGKLIGSTLDALLEAVIADPTLNERDTLIRMAKDILNGKGN